MKKKSIIMSVFFTVCSILYTLAVKTVDVAAIGPNNSKVGFSHLNDSYRSLINSNMDIY